MKLATLGNTVGAPSPALDILHTSAVPRRPDSNTTVGEPVPLHSMYIWRPPPMSTKPAKSLSSTAAACVVSLDPDDVEVSELLSLHPAATSARAMMVMCIKRLKSFTFLPR